MSSPVMSQKSSDIPQRIIQCFHELKQEAEDLYLDKQVPVLTSVPTPLQFYRHHVSPNKPVLVKGATDHWAARGKWSPEYLRSEYGELEVTVAVTPNGYADAVDGGRFMLPQERTMTFSQFLDILDKPDSANGIFYIQKQNSNMTEEFSSLLQDIQSDLPWATEAFGKLPDAVNFWMGDRRAVTSMHRDHYENIYCVMSGWKKFLLLPPTSLPFVPYQELEIGRYKENDSGKFEVVNEVGKLPWIAIDALAPDLASYPQYRHVRPVEVTVHAGETLYLPSLWFHHVQQSHGCIAVNFWYDMEFDIKYNYYKFLENLKNITTYNEDPT